MIDYLQKLLLVGSGGFVGASLRFTVATICQRLGTGQFPWGTLIVNVVGSLVIGLVAGLAEGRELLTPSGRLFLFTGLLGGFTTFSALALESVTLAAEGMGGKAALSVASQLLLGLGAAWVAYFAGQQL